jgi:AraC-like DNA-binding protein
MPLAPSQNSSPVRTLPSLGDRQSGGRESRLSFVQVSESAPAVSMQSPSLVYYGVVEGRMRVSVADGTARSLGDGESLLVPPLQTIQTEFPDTEQTPNGWVVLEINQERVQDLLDQVGPLTDPASARGREVRDRAFVPLEKQAGIRQIFHQMALLFREDPPYRDALLDLNVQQLIIRLLQTEAYPLLVEGPSRHSAGGGIAAAVQYIQDHLDRHISIDELVDQACMSKSSFYRHFNDQFDMSPLEYITQERVVRARGLLSDPDNTVADVSHALGFSSTSHFIDMFKEHEGRTPKQYQLDEAEAPASSREGTA